MFKQLLSFSLLCLGLAACGTNNHSHLIGAEEMNDIAGYETPKGRDDAQRQKEKEAKKLQSIDHSY